MDFEQLNKFLQGKKQPNFRLAQIKKAYFIELADSFEETFTLPKELREELAKRFSFSSVQFLRYRQDGL